MTEPRAREASLDGERDRVQDAEDRNEILRVGDQPVNPGPM